MSGRSANHSPGIEDSSDVLVTHPAVRLYPPASTEAYWIAEDLNSRLRFRINETAALTLLWYMKGRRPRHGDIALSKRLSLPRPQVSETLETLMCSGLILSQGQVASDANLRRFLDVKRGWADCNWNEAADYHLLTLGYDFADYAVDGRAVDTQRMRTYSAVKYDGNRYKNYKHARRVFLPHPSASLAREPLSTGFIEGGKLRLTVNVLFEILSISFAQTGAIQIKRWRAEPAIRTTSPSGGARHPIEGYLFNVSVDGLTPGIYHIGVSPVRLDLLREAIPSAEILNHLFPGCYRRLKHRVQAIVALTCIFERNMYRYREPRTFRTVHMDAGHVAETVCMLAAAKGTYSAVTYSENDVGIEECLGIEGLEEGFMASVGLGYR